MPYHVKRYEAEAVNDLKYSASASKPGAGAYIHNRLFRLARDVHAYLPGAAALSQLTAVVVILQMYLLAVVISNVFLYGERVQTTMLFALAFVIVCRGIILWLKEKHVQRHAIRIKSEIRNELLHKLLSLSPSFARTEKTGELVAVLMDGVEKLDDYYTKYVPSIIHIALLPATIIIFTLFSDWLSGLIMLLTAPLILFFMWLIGTHARGLSRKQWGALSHLSSHFLDVLQGIRALRQFGVNRREAANIEASSEGFRHLTMKVLRVAFLSGMVLELAASISIALVAVQIGIRLIEGLMGYQLGLFLLLLAPEFYMPFRLLGQHHHAGMEGAAAAIKIFDILDLHDDIKVEGVHPISPNQGVGVVVSNVCYTYPGASTPALSRISCSLKPGTFTAIVGQAGSGKTTFTQLLLGFLRPESGSIVVNETDLAAIQEDRWHSLVSFVPQHPHFFNGTIAENLLMARPDATIEQMRMAAYQSGAAQFIESMPAAYHTMLTENASRLSGGEKQRLAIARAILKDAPLCIMDEPTSNLDPDSEQLIASALGKLAEGRTLLVIAHRLNTVRRADMILVFRQGQIAEYGNHTILKEQKGIYAGFLQTLEKRWEGGI